MLYDDEYFWNDDYSEYEEFMCHLKDTLRGQIKDEKGVNNDNSK